MNNGTALRLAWVLLGSLALAACRHAGSAEAGSSLPAGAVLLGAPAPARKARPAPAQPGVNVPAIKVNTVGYPPEWP
jgi:hypothetical protein